MTKKVAMWVGVALCLGTIIAGIAWYFMRDKEPTVAPASAPAETRISSWEILKLRVEGNEFFRCQRQDDCRGYVVRGKDPTGTKMIGVLGSDGSLTITIMSGPEESLLSLIYTDSNGDGNLDQLSGSSFPGPASVNKMPENLRKEAIKKFENLVGDLVKTSDKTLEDALYGAPK